VAIGCSLILSKGILQTCISQGAVVQKAEQLKFQGSETINESAKNHAGVGCSGGIMNRCLPFFGAFLAINGAFCCLAYAQELKDSKTGQAQKPEANFAGPPARELTADYVLGPGDQISLIVPGLEEQYNEKVFRIDASGDVSLPEIGRIHVSGLNTGALEHVLQASLKPVLKEPQVVVSVASFGSQPVSVLGAVRNPGIIQLQGRKTLFEVLSMAGGLQPDAGYLARVTRSLKNGNIPLPTVQTDSAAHVGIASIKLKDIINVPNVSDNIEILPGDTISVPKAGIVYVVGSVTKPGGYPLDENESLSALQVLSLAEGLQRTAASSKARILRNIPGSSNRTEIPVNLNRLMAGKEADLQLNAGDILFVPGSKAKNAGLRTVEAIVNAATYASVYAR
jgi:polysaccharide export outer membrane protein